MKSSTTVTKVSRRLSYLVVVILVLLPFHAFFTTWGGSNTGYIDLWRVWKEVLLVFILTPATLWIVWKIPDIRKGIAESWLARIILCYACLHFLLGTWAFASDRVNSESLIYSLGSNLRFLLFFMICVVLASTCSLLKDNWRNILLIPAYAVLIFGLFQKFVLPYDFLRHFGYGDNTIPFSQTVDSNIMHRRIQSFLKGANPLGAYLVIVVSCLMVLMNKSIKSILLISLSIIILFFSYSRSGLVGVLAALILLSFLAYNHGSKRRLLLGLSSIFIILIAIVAYSLQNNDTYQRVFFHTTENSTSIQSSNAARLESMENGTKDILNEPLGRGPGTAGPASFRNTELARISENYFLQIGQEVGVLGMGLFIAINTMIAIMLWVRRADSLSLVLLVSLVGLTVVNLISHAWTDDTISLIWWGLAGVALAPAILKKA